MSLDEFRQSVKLDAPPLHLSKPMTGLWWDAKGNWDNAHESAQQDEGAAGSWVHAYLHRKEGDISNAGYWYRRAGKPDCKSTLNQEWLEIATALLGEGNEDK